jgi:hypothetical protein
MELVRYLSCPSNSDLMAAIICHAFHHISVQVGVVSYLVGAERVCIHCNLVAEGLQGNSRQGACPTKTIHDDPCELSLVYARINMRQDLYIHVTESLCVCLQKYMRLNTSQLAR